MRSVSSTIQILLKNYSKPLSQFTLLKIILETFLSLIIQCKFKSNAHTHTRNEFSLCRKNKCKGFPPPQLFFGEKSEKLLNFACDWLQMGQIEWPQVKECGKKWEFSLSAQTESRRRGGKAEKRKSINSVGAQCKCDFNVALKMQRFATPKAAETMLQIIKMPANCQT